MKELTEAEKRKRSDKVDEILRAHPNFFEDTETEEGVTTITLLGRKPQKPQEEKAE